METSRTEVPIDADLMDLVPGFCEARKKEMQLLNEHLKNSDFEAIQRISHTVKGIAAPYGFPSLETLFRSLEVAAKQKDTPTMEQYLQSIQKYVEKYF